MLYIQLGKNNVTSWKKYLLKFYYFLKFSVPLIIGAIIVDVNFTASFALIRKFTMNKNENDSKMAKYGFQH